MNNTFIVLRHLKNTFIYVMHILSNKTFILHSMWLPCYKILLLIQIRLFSVNSRIDNYTGKLSTFSNRKILFR